MPNKVRWGVLGVAQIATRHVIPAFQQGEWSEVIAIASRQLDKATAAAHSLGIPKAYGTYLELLNDPEIEAVYNPLPNHMHVQWTLEAVKAGKHVLCEKPIGMNADEVRTLIAAQERTGVNISEAFIVRTHPQWLRLREIIEDGRIGRLRSIVAFYSYFNRNPQNIRNVPAFGGGALMDLGCYLITTSRFAFGEEPVEVMGRAEQDPNLKIDRLTSGILEFPSGRTVFTCSTQVARRQQMLLLGSEASIELEFPFNAPDDRPCRLFIDDGQDLYGGGTTIETIPTCNQYSVLGSSFSRAIREGRKVAVSIEDSIKNMAVIDAIFRSAESGKWERPQVPGGYDIV